MKRLGFAGAVCGILTLLPMVMTTVAVLWFLPETIPVHYGFSGQVDRWGSKYESFIFPGISLVFGTVMLLAAWSAARSPGKDGEQSIRILLIAGNAGMAVFNAMTIFFLYLFWAQVEHLSGVPEIGLRILLAVIVVLLLILGAAMPQVKQNAWFGIRTKWTMQSAAVWKKSQRFGGKLFMAAALLCLASLALPFPWVAGVHVFAVTAAAAGSWYYSRREGLKEKSPKSDN